MCDAYRAQYGCNFTSAMPTNLYGPNDNYDLNTSNVLPALLRKFITATREGQAEVQLWGTGRPKREFMHVDDLADACLFLMQHYNETGLVSIGWGKDISIAELAHLIQHVTGFKGHTQFDTSKPDGTPRKLMEVTKLTTLGWHPRILLEQGLRMVYEEGKNEPWNNAVG
jgi:GDP-L-fucose synthase